MANTEYYWKNPEKYRAQATEWRKNNLAKKRETNRLWAERNPEKIKTSGKKYYKRNAAKFREYGKRYRELNPHRGYNITLEEYNRLLEKGCAICGKPNGEGKLNKLVIDHCHTTGKVRGLLCRCCNSGIGLLQESFPVIIRAADYVRRHACSGS